jgi:hypothetical protein
MELVGAAVPDIMAMGSPQGGMKAGPYMFLVLGRSLQFEDHLTTYSVKCVFDVTSVHQVGKGGQQ